MGMMDSWLPTEQALHLIALVFKTGNSPVLWAFAVFPLLHSRQALVADGPGIMMDSWLPMEQELNRSVLVVKTGISQSCSLSRSVVGVFRLYSRKSWLFHHGSFVRN